jgi:hypothetical protein
MDGYSWAAWAVIKEAWFELGRHPVWYTLAAFVIGLTLNQIRIAF